MKKNNIKKNSIVINAICIIAILATLICQFIPCWKYTGVINDAETGEQHVVNMKTSIASYVWVPSSNTSVAFVNYLKDPTLTFSELSASKSFTAEEIAKSEELSSMIPTFSTSNETSEEPTEKTSTDAVTENTASADSDKNVEEEKPVAAPTAEKDDSKYTYRTTLVEIKEHHLDPTEASYNTILSKKADSAAAFEEYKNYAKKISTNYAKFINGFVFFPILVLIASILGIAFIIISLRKGISSYVAPIFTLVIGVLNLITLLTQHIFILSNVIVFSIMTIISGATAIIGLVILCVDIVSAANHKYVADNSVNCSQ